MLRGYWLQRTWPHVWDGSVAHERPHTVRRSILLHDEQQLSSRYTPTRLTKYLPHCAVDRRIHRNFHFHGFDDQQRASGRDVLPRLDEQLPYRAGHMLA